MSQSAPWTEPPWSGWIETTGDALLILEAARRGMIPRVTRRLIDSERKMICSGSVFVFDEAESGIKRWTDGYYWSPSRILGNFLLYRETDKKSASQRGKVNDIVDDGLGLSRPKSDSALEGPEKQRERTLMGSLTNNFKFKNDGLMKKTFSLCIDGVAQHLISYYKISDVENGRLRSPSSLPELAALAISPDYLDKTHFRNPPKVEIGVDGIPRYRGEADDIDTSDHMLSAPLSSGMPLFTEARVPEKRSVKRFEPYAATVTKRRKKSDESPQVVTPSSLPPTSTAILPPGIPSHMPPPGYSNYPPPLPPSSNYYPIPPGYPNPPMPPHIYVTYPSALSQPSYPAYPTPPPLSSASPLAYATPLPPPDGTAQQPHYSPYHSLPYAQYIHPPAPPPPPPSSWPTYTSYHHFQTYSKDPEKEHTTITTTVTSS